MSPVKVITVLNLCLYHTKWASSPNPESYQLTQDLPNPGTILLASVLWHLFGWNLVNKMADELPISGATWRQCAALKSSFDINSSSLDLHVYPNYRPDSPKAHRDKQEAYYTSRKHHMRIIIAYQISIIERHKDAEPTFPMAWLCRETISTSRIYSPCLCVCTIAIKGCYK